MGNGKGAAASATGVGVEPCVTVKAKAGVTGCTVLALEGVGEGTKMITGRAVGDAAGSVLVWTGLAVAGASAVGAGVDFVALQALSQQPTTTIVKKYFICLAYFVSLLIRTIGSLPKGGCVNKRQAPKNYNHKRPLG